MNIPADMFKLFVTVDVFTGRFGTLLAGVHTVGLSILVTASVVGLLKVRWRQLGIFLGGSVVLVICTLLAINLFFTHFVENRYTKGDAVKVLPLMGEPWENTRVYTEFTEQAPVPEQGAEGESALDRIKHRQLLRACYIPGLLPQSYLNESGNLVGYDIELAHMLAAELGVRLDLIPIERSNFVQHLEEGWCDIITTGLTITPARARRASLSNPYLIDGLSFVVPDSKRRLFASVEQLRKQPGLKIGVLRGLSLYEAHIRRLLPDAEIIRLESFQDFFFHADGQQSADALVTLAMIGSAYNHFRIGHRSGGVAPESLFPGPRDAWRSLRASRHVSGSHRARHRRSAR